MKQLLDRYNHSSLILRIVIGIVILKKPLWMAALAASAACFLVYWIPLWEGLKKVGTAVGAVTGYFGGLVDDTLMRINDALTAFPSILMALLVISLLGPERKSSLILALGIVFIPSFARVTRTAFASLRDVNYITSARLMGAGNGRILLLHLLPNTGRVLLPALTIGFNNAVLAEASMSFLRITPLETSLGYMLSEAQGMLATAPWYALSTGLVIALLVFGVGLIGEGLQQRNKEA